LEALSLLLGKVHVRWSEQINMISDLLHFPSKGVTEATDKIDDPSR
jgi:hypothetical protein